MAYVNGIELHRPYRNLEPFTLRFAPDQDSFQHLIVTGPNGSGKSSLLAAMNEELERIIADPPEPARDGSLLSLSFDRPQSEVREEFVKGRAFLAYITAQRALKPSRVQGPSKLNIEERATRRGQAELSQHFLQFLVNRHTEKAFATVDNDNDAVARISKWFDDFVLHLQWLTDDSELELLFDRPNYNFRIRLSNGFEFDLHTLADGYASVLMIFAELILRVELCRKTVGDLRYEPSGVVLIDEVETHLHLQLQKQILPFVTNLMPRVQFLVATHSPPVIASIDNALVYDLEQHEAVPSRDYLGVQYGSLMTEHFGLESDMNNETTAKLKRARALMSKDERDPEEQRELQQLAGELSRLSPRLELELWYAREGIGPGKRAGKVTDGDGGDSGAGQ